MRSVDYLLIGGGVAALSCAEELRARGADGSVLVVGREEEPAYERPLLSKGYLSGRTSREDALLKAESWWQDNDVEWLGRKSVMKLDAGERVAKLPGDEVQFGSALLATGANVRRLRVDGSDVDGIHYLRAFGNADAIREDALSGGDAGRVVLVGGSWIGCEVAATLSSLGVPCSIVMLEDVCCQNHLGVEVGGFVQGLLEANGVEVHPRSEVERFEGDDSGRVARVVLAGGGSIDCSCVVIGAGVVPDVLLARSLGASLGATGGFACSWSLETSVPGVFCAGDACEWDSPLHGRPARVEHWEVAAAHGRAAARAMVGDAADPFAEVPYFWSDLSDWAKLEYVGIEAGSPVVRGSIEDGDFTALYVNEDGRVVGAATVGRGEDLEEAKRLVAAKAAPDAAALADSEKPLSEF